MDTSRHSLRVARDRVLLYARGLDIDPIKGLELALESLRAADKFHSDPASCVAMALDVVQRLNADVASPVASAAAYVQPPLNRRHMVAEPLGGKTIRANAWQRRQADTPSTARNDHS